MVYGYYIFNLLYKFKYVIGYILKLRSNFFKRDCIKAKFEILYIYKYLYILYEQDEIL